MSWFPMRTGREPHPAILWQVEKAVKVAGDGRHLARFWNVIIFFDSTIDLWNETIWILQKQNGNSTFSLQTTYLLFEARSHFQTVCPQLRTSPCQDRESGPDWQKLQQPRGQSKMKTHFTHPLLLECIAWQLKLHLNWRLFYRWPLHARHLETVDVFPVINGIGVFLGIGHGDQMHAAPVGWVTKLIYN